MKDVMGNSFAVKFISLSHRIIEQLELKSSHVREELVIIKETLNRAILDKEVLDQQKAEVGELLRTKKVYSKKIVGDAMLFSSFCLVSRYFLYVQCTVNSNYQI